MTRRLTLSLPLAALVTLVTTARARAADPVLVFVLAGQSNMVGFGEGDALPPELASQPEVLYDHYNADARAPGVVGDRYANATSSDWGPLEPKGTPGRYGPEITFAKALGAALPGRTLAIVKVAQNGTNLDEHWARNPLGEPARGLPPDPEALHKSQLYHALMGGFDSAIYAPQPSPPPAPGAPPAPGSNALYYPNETSRLDRALARLTQRGQPYELGAFVWMQGENEASRKLDVAAKYGARLAAFIAAVRQDLKAPALPFLVGRVSDNLSAKNGGPVAEERGASIDAVRAAQRAVADADPAVALIDTDDLAPREGDPYHFDAAGYRRLGERFAAAFLALPPPGRGGAAPAAGRGGGASHGRALWYALAALPALALAELARRRLRRS
jgi:lysophospholipase L1-like esterase